MGGNGGRVVGSMILNWALSFVFFFVVALESVILNLC